MQNLAVNCDLQFLEQHKETQQMYLTIFVDATKSCLMSIKPESNAIESAKSISVSLMIWLEMSH